MKIGSVSVEVIPSIKVDLGITLWQAIKLRIAGKRYLPIAEMIGKQIVENLKGEDSVVKETK